MLVYRFVLEITSTLNLIGCLSGISNALLQQNATVLTIPHRDIYVL